MGRAIKFVRPVAIGTDINQLKAVMATATATATVGDSRDTTTAAAEGSHVERTGGMPQRHRGGRARLATGGRVE